jgi:hypothetical protein
MQKDFPEYQWVCNLVVKITSRPDLRLSEREIPLGTKADSRSKDEKDLGKTTSVKRPKVKIFRATVPFNMVPIFNFCPKTLLQINENVLNV